MSHSARLFEESNEQGFPLVSLDSLRVARETLVQIPPVSSPWSSFPLWCQEAIQKAMNEVFKVHHSALGSLEKAVKSLTAHKVAGTFPQVVLAAASGVKNFHIDATLPNESQSLLSAAMDNTILQARSSLLNTILESKERALQSHKLLASHAYVLACCRDRIFDSLLSMGYTMDNLDLSFVHDTIRSLCHLRYQMEEKLKTQAWVKLQAERKKQKVSSAADTVMDHTNDLNHPQLTESIEKLVQRTVASKVSALSKNLKSLSVSSASSRPSGPSRGPPRGRPAPASASSRQANHNSRSSGKGSRPSVGSSKGRVQKGAPSSGPRRLAPGPSPFKQLKGSKRD